MTARPLPSPQASLFSALIGDSIEARFRRFHAAHPEVYEGLRRVCREAVYRGWKRWSIDAAYHVMRWERLRTYRDPHEDFKLNDHYTALYARLLMENEPELGGLFEIRQRRASRESRA